MAVVHHDRHALEIEQVEPSRRAVGIARKRLQADPHKFQRHTEPPRGGGTGQRVLHLEGHQALMHQRHLVELRESRFTRAVAEHDPALANGGCEAACGEMLDDERVGRIDGEVDHLTFAPFLHVDDERVGGVEDGGAAGPHGRDDRPLHPGQLLRRVDLADAEMISLADVGDHSHVAAVEATALAEDAASCGLEHRRRHRRVGKHAAGALRTATVAGVDLAAADPYALGAGRAHGRAPGGRDVRQQSHHGRLAVRARDRGGGNPPGLPLGKHRVDDRTAHLARRAHGGLEVHPQAGGRVDLDHRPPLRLERLRDVGGHDVDAGHVEADDPRRLDGPRGHLRMHGIGHVFRRAAGAQVRVLPQEHHSFGGRHALRRETLLGEHGQSHLIDRNRREHVGVVTTPPRILVHRIDELPHRRRAVADDRRTIPPRRGHHLAADHEQPMVVAGHEPLDHDR